MTQPRSMVKDRERMNKVENKANQAQGCELHVFYQRGVGHYQRGVGQWL